MSFDEFWSRYPRKIGKGGRYGARNCYKNALKLATHEEIMAGLERFIEAEPWHGELQYCPYPGTWLNREGWADEYDEPVKRDWWDARKADDEFKRRLKVVK